MPYLATAASNPSVLPNIIPKTSLPIRRRLNPPTILKAPMKPPLRIAILECDTPIGKTKAKYGGYGNVFRALLEAGAEHLAQKDDVAKPELKLEYYDVVGAQAYPKLEDVDAVLLTGSRTSPSSYSMYAWNIYCHAC